jgi:hypothetical protein
MDTSGEIEQLEKVFLSRGASPSQAMVMAGQLSKRADQWVVERGLSRLEALQRLLEIVIAGRGGMVPDGFNGDGSGEEKPVKDN